MKNWLRLTSRCLIFGLPVSCALAASADDELFAGIWARSCASGVEYIFHDRDRLKIVDLDCQILGWRKSGEHFTSALRCTLDGVEDRSRIDVVPSGDRLRVTMEGLTEMLRKCP